MKVALSGLFQRLFNEKLLLNSYALIGNNFLTAGASYFFWILAARLFPSDTVGVASVGLAALALVSLICSFGLDFGLSRFLPASQDRNAESALLSTSFVIRLVATATVALTFLLGIPWWSPELALLQSPVYAALFVTLALSDGLFLLFNASYVAYRDTRYVLIAGLIFNTVKLLVLVALPARLGVLVILSAVAAASLVTVFLGKVAFLPKLAPRALRLVGWRNEAPRIRQFVRYSLWNQSSAIIAELPSKILPLLVLNGLGARESAYFYVAWMTASLVRTASVSISQVAFAEISFKEASSGVNLRKSFQLTLGTVLGLGAALVLLSPYLLSFFGTEYAASGGRTLVWYVAAVLPFAVTNLYLMIQRLAYRMWMVNLLSLVGAVVSLGGAALGLLLAASQGLAIGWFCGQVAYMLVCLAIWWSMEGRPSMEQRRFQGI